MGMTITTAGCPNGQSLLNAQHDLVITSLHHHLNHDQCVEAEVLCGLTERVCFMAQQLIALRGVRHGSMHRVLLPPLKTSQRTQLALPHGYSLHTHRKPLT